MVNRYGYNWEYLTVTGGGFNADGDPVAGTETWTAFQCDVQTSSGRFVTSEAGDKIPVNYSIFTNINTGLKKGGSIRDESGNKYTVLNIHNYGGNFEIWV